MGHTLLWVCDTPPPIVATEPRRTNFFSSLGGDKRDTPTTPPPPAVRENESGCTILGDESKHTTTLLGPFGSSISPHTGGALTPSWPGWRVEG